MGDFEVKRTVSIEDLRREAFRDVKIGFDENPLKEVRERCLESVFPWGDEDFEWLVERIKAYREISDYPTMILLLRRIILFKLSQYERASRIFNEERHIVIRDLLVEALEVFLKEKFLQDNLPQIKEALVMLCGRLKDFPQLYNDRARKVFQKMYERYVEDRTPEGNTKVPIYAACDIKFKEDYERLLQRILKIVILVKDKEFLPLLYQIEKAKRVSLDFYITYYRLGEEELTLEALRVLAIRYLESC